jgi:hypothetical protein
MDKVVSSILEFCSRHNFSRSSFFNPLKAVTDPRLMKVENPTFTATEAGAEAWRSRCDVVADKPVTADDRT